MEEEVQGQMDCLACIKKIYEGEGRLAFLSVGYLQANEAYEKVSLFFVLDLLFHIEVHINVSLSLVKAVIHGYIEADSGKINVLGYKKGDISIQAVLTGIVKDNI